MHTRRVHQDPKSNRRPDLRIGNKPAQTLALRWNSGEKEAAGRGRQWRRASRGTAVGAGLLPRRGVRARGLRRAAVNLYSAGRRNDPPIIIGPASGGRQPRAPEMPFRLIRAMMFA